MNVQGTRSTVTKMYNQEIIDQPYEIWENILIHAGFETCIELGWDNLAEKLYDGNWRKICRIGDLKAVKWLIKLNKNQHLNAAAEIAAECGHLEILKYLYEHGADCDQWIMESAIDYGHVNIIKYLVSIDEAFVPSIIFRSDLERDTYHNTSYETYPIDIAARNGYVELFKYLYEHEHGHECEQYTIYYAAKYGYIAIIKYICETIIPSSNINKEINVAVKQGDIESLRYIYYRNHYSILPALEIANTYNQIDVVKYLSECFVQSSIIVIKIATENGHDDIVKYINDLIKRNTG
jgi:ankyrin repeat protein